MTSKQEILDYAEILFAHCRVALSYLETYQGLIKRHVPHRSAMLEARLFFNVIEKALASEFMIEVCKVFENHRDVMSIFKLCNICEQNKILFEGIFYNIQINGDTLPVPLTIDMLVKEVRSALDERDNIISNLKSQRDQIWAHSDQKYFLCPEKVETDNPVPLDEIKELLCVVVGFTDMIIKAFTGKFEAPYFDKPNACDSGVDRVIQLMELGREKEKNNDGQAKI